MWHSGTSNQRGSYISVWLSAHLVLSLLLETADILWPDRICRTKLSYRGQSCFRRVWIAFKSLYSNWPTENLAEGQVSTFPGFAEDNTDCAQKAFRISVSHVMPHNFTLKCCWTIISTAYYGKYQVDSNLQISSLQTRFTWLWFGQSDKNKTLIQLTTKLSGSISTEFWANHTLTVMIFKETFFPFNFK